MSEVPAVVNAPTAGGALAAAVTRAGGPGFIGGGYGDVSWIDEQLDIAADAAVGVGLIAWVLQFRPCLVERLVPRGVRWVWLSFGEAAPHVGVIHQAGVVALCNVQTVSEARRVARVVIGTRLYASHEALDTDAAKDRLVGRTATCRTTVFDHVRAPAWSPGYTGRAAVTSTVERWHGREAALRANLDAARHDHRWAVATDDTDGRAVWAGTAVACIHEILPAGTIVRAIAGPATASPPGEAVAGDPFRRPASKSGCGEDLPHG